MFPEFGKEFGQYLVMMNLKTLEFGKPWDEESFKNPQRKTEMYHQLFVYLHTESERLTHHAWHVSDWSVAVIRPRMHLPHSCT